MKRLLITLATVQFSARSPRSSLAPFQNARFVLRAPADQTNLTFVCALPERWDAFRQTRGTLASLYRADMGLAP